MNDRQDGPADPSRRRMMGSGAALIGAQLLPGGQGAQAAEPPPRPAAPSPVAPDSPPAGYNILFILVDQEHFFERWPFPVPGREWIKANGISFTNHQAASCVCSPARSTLYTGQHIQHTRIFDNANSPWQADLATDIKTIGHRLAGLGYHAAYQGKWHLSYNLDKVKQAVEAPMAEYRKTMETYGFQDFFGFGDVTDTTLGGYNYDEATTAFSARWLRTTGLELKAKGQPWYLAVNFVNPHDVMYINSDLPGETVQGKSSAMGIARPPDDVIYKATWDDAPLPATRSQPFDAPGRPAAQRIYQSVQDTLVGQWPDEDRRWRVLRDYYFNCIRDCDRQVVALLDALRQTGMDRDTIIVFTADHGELGGAHQMRGKGNSTYREQNHLPLMVVHPAYPGGSQCRAVTSQIDLTPTLIALTGAAPDARKAASDGLPGRDFSTLMKAPATAGVDALRPGALFNYNMLLFQDAKWIVRAEQVIHDDAMSGAQKMAWMKQYEPDFHGRCAIRSLFDGRYRFSRYFAPLAFNTPDTWEALVAANDLELYDLEADPTEARNLAADGTKHRDLILAMNAKLNARIAEEVGVDDGSFLPLKNGQWVFPGPDQR
ncbi:sulfatase-like hydrolase/transferase [Azorhizobium doebereinerae]|uniref:sulfatase-like hydrolase/transferase n=1 Tax=Azorhizobium doebereinerae TaxID=281091 RepID=UPI00040CA96E|nr:sulfatase-like hydrolase/transferase [Azorhizobium doebereinerae]